MKLKDYLWVTCLTFVSFCLTGYYFGFLDHNHYLPYLNKLLNPLLYANDYFFSQPHYLYSPFNWVIVGLKQLSGLNLAWTYLLIYLVSLWLLYLAVYYLTRVLYQKTEISVLAVLLFLLPKWAAQIGYMTHHFYFVSRDLSLALSLLALAFLLRQKLWSGAAFLALAAFANPSIPIPVALLWLLCRLKKTSFVAPMLIPVNQSWLSTLQHRGTYSFPHLWRWTGWGNLGLFLSLLGTSWLVLKHRLFGRFNGLMKIFLSICAGLFLVHFIISALIPIPELIQLQLLRSLNYIFILALISFSAAAYDLISRRRWLIKLLALISLAGVYFWGDHLTAWHFLAIWPLPLVLLFCPGILKRTIPFKPVPILIAVLLGHLFVRLIIVQPQINLPYYFYYPNALITLDNFSEWLALQDWVRQNTPVNAVFLTPPKLAGFRNFSERGIVTDIKDGGLTFYSPIYAQEWQTRITSLTNYRQFNEAAFSQLNELYPFQYLVVEANHQPLNFNLVYQNQKYLLYQL